MINKQNSILLLTLLALTPHKAVLGCFDSAGPCPTESKKKLLKNFEALSQQVERGANPSMLNPLLRSLILYDELSLLEKALQQGADANYNSLNGSPMNIALLFQNTNAVNLILDYGADPNKIEDMHTPLLMVTLIIIFLCP